MKERNKNNLRKFYVKKISPKKTVGEKLRDLRDSKFYTTKRLSKLLLIHEKYIKAIEEGRYDNLPDEMYTKNYIASYAKFFGLDPAPYLNQYLEESKSSKIKKIENLPKTSPIKIPSFWNTTNLIRNTIIIVFVIAFVSYIGFEIKKITTPPNLSLSTPQDEEVVEKPVIQVVGKTEKEAILKINDELVTPHSDGTFNEDVDLQRGLNLIKISAANKYSKENIIYRKIIFQENLAFK